MFVCTNYFEHSLPLLVSSSMSNFFFSGGSLKLHFPGPFATGYIDNFKPLYLLRIIKDYMRLNDSSGKDSSVVIEFSLQQLSGSSNACSCGSVRKDFCQNNPVT